MKRLVHVIILFCSLSATYGQKREDGRIYEGKKYDLDSAKVAGFRWIFNSQGNVYDFEGKPIEGVVVTYRFKDKFVRRDTTDAKGKFYIDSIIGKSGLLRFDKEGFTSFAQKVSSSVNLYITMMMDETGVYAERDAGYFKFNKLKNVMSVTSLTAKDIEQNNIRNHVVDAIVAKGGVVIQKERFLIRGSDYYVMAVVVDGMLINPKNNISSVANKNLNMLPMTSNSAVCVDDLDYLNASDVESIEILKDAAGTAMYGVRGGGGVIVIRTKKGNEKIRQQAAALKAKREQEKAQRADRKK